MDLDGKMRELAGLLQAVEWKCAEVESEAIMRPDVAEYMRKVRMGLTRVEGFCRDGDRIREGVVVGTGTGSRRRSV